ncbi:MAG: leucine-rich repeat domain-containing protein [Lachnospiraceae bacterium]|nr:leucine-rich repeat domain-containing protein [Lachnospiraceae bacterium]
MILLTYNHDFLYFPRSRTLGLIVFVLCLTFLLPGISRAAGLSETVAAAETPAEETVMPEAGAIYETENYVFEFMADGREGYRLVSAGKNLMEAVIPETANGFPVLEIGMDAFRNHSDLKAVFIPDSVTDISPVAFSGCTGLEELVLPDSITSMVIVSGCTSLTRIRLSAGILGMTGNMDLPGEFKDTAVTFLDIPEGIIQVGSKLFADSAIEEVILPVSLLTFDSYCLLDERNRVHTFYYRGTEGFFDSIDLLDERVDKELLQKMIESKVCFYSFTRPAENPERYWHEADGRPVRWSGEEDASGHPGGEESPDGFEKEFGVFEPKDRIITEDFVFEWRPGKYSDDLFLTGVREDLRDAVVPARVNGIAVTRITGSAFRNHEMLRSVIVSSGILTIDAEAFKGCVNLETLILPDSVCGIGSGFLSGCTALKTLRLSCSGNRYGLSGIEIGEDWFAGSGLKVLEIPEGINTLHCRAFADSCLEAVILPETMRLLSRGRIGDAGPDGKPANALLNSDIKTVYCRGSEADWAWFFEGQDGSPDICYFSENRPAEHPERYWQYVFGEPKAWSTIQGPDLAGIGIRKIFTETTAVYRDPEETVVSDGFIFVRSLQDEGLILDGLAEDMETAVIPGVVCGLPVIEVNAHVFDGSSVQYVIQPDTWDTSMYIQDLAWEYNRVESIFAYRGDGGLILCRAGAEGESVTVPREVNGIPVLEIGSFAFFGNSVIRELIIPEGIQVIGAHAFHMMPALEYLELPDSVSELGPNLCWYCFRLSEVRLPSGIETLDSALFYMDEALAELRIPEGVRKVTHALFADTGIRTVTLPRSLEEMDEDCFRSVSVRVETFLYPGSEEDWDNVIVRKKASTSKKKLDAAIASKLICMET